MEFEKVKKIPQRHKDIVFGYLRNCCSNNASYYQIPKPVQYSILLFYFASMESQILTPQEIDACMKLFAEQNKFSDIGAYEYKLLYASYTHGIHEEIFKKMCHDQKNLVVFIHSTAIDDTTWAQTENIWGGFTSTGWAGKNLHAANTQYDDKAFMFSICDRLKASNPPKIFNVVNPHNALCVEYDRFCMFGALRKYFIKGNGCFGGVVTACVTSDYEVPPRDYYMTGSDHFVVKSIEVFQLCQGSIH